MEKRKPSEFKPGSRSPKESLALCSTQSLAIPATDAKLYSILPFPRTNVSVEVCWMSNIWSFIEPSLDLCHDPSADPWGLEKLTDVWRGIKYYFPGWEFIFRTCEVVAVWHLIPRKISPSYDSFFGHIGTGRYVGVNLGLDWPPLARVYQISRYHTPTWPLRLPTTPRIMEDMGL